MSQVDAGRHDEEGEGRGRWYEKALRDRRMVLLSGEVSDRSARELIAQFLALDAQDPEAPISFLINSGGGGISSGFAIFDTIRMISAPVRTVGAGLVASMGVTLLLSVPAERRFSLPNTRYMIHQPLISGTMVAPASDLEISAREMVKLKEHLNRLIAEATGQPLDRVEKDTLRDYWMDAGEAEAYGLVSSVIRHLGELPE
ncbi:MAG: ATP-dependent Clp protease proteolytic subunit [Deltaproteobacteria bacterium]|nr:ATP-dependent Clp protease proteolytic subunit [Deltaproteobacteria bacterium]